MFNRVTGYFDNWTTFEKVWLATFTAIGVVLSITMESSIVGFVAMITGMWAVVLVAKGEISNYAFGVVNVALYGLMAWQSQFYGEVMLNWIYYLPLQFVGYYFWKQNMSGEVVKVKAFSAKQRLGMYVGSIAAIGGYGLLLKALKGNLPFFDATSTVLSVIAQLMMIARSKDQWILWIIIDVVTIYMWTTSYLTSGQGITMIVMWTAYLVNAIYGWWNWNQMEANAA